MDLDMFKTNMNAVKEMILDEDKLVTYTSLSKDMCVHVNESKSLLKKVVEETREKHPDINLNVSYIISGLLDDNKARTTVCSESDISKLKEGFKVLSFEHIYSVSKGLSSIDNVSFLAVNKFEDLPLCTGLIKNNSCMYVCICNELLDLKTRNQAANNGEQKPIKTISAPSVKKLERDSDTTVKNGITRNESKSEPIIKTEKLSPKKAFIDDKQKTNKTSNSKPQKGITGFFNKSSNVPNKSDKKLTVDKGKHVNGSEVKLEPMEVDDSEFNKIVDNNQVHKKEASKKPEKKEEKSKIANKIKNAKVDKKRKRVLMVSDSESDEEKDPFKEEPVVKQESDDEIPPTPTVNTIKIESALVNPKKRRKIVDKTYTDEDGYILTKKEEVYESCSDEDEVKKENIKQPNHVKPKVSPNEKQSIGAKASKKKISPPQKGKQSMLTSFFKKV